MQPKRKLAYIVSACGLSLSGIVLFLNVWAQASEEAQITFVSDRGGNWDIYAVDTDGKNLRNLTEHRAFDYAPSCSPDGRRIMFLSNRDGNYDIYVMARAFQTGGQPYVTRNHEVTTSNHLVADPHS